MVHRACIGFRAGQTQNPQLNLSSHGGPTLDQAFNRGAESQFTVQHQVSRGRVTKVNQERRVNLLTERLAFQIFEPLYNSTCPDVLASTCVSW